MPDILRAYRTLGLLGWVALGMLVVGAYVQHTSSWLPSGYTWLEPLDTLKVVFQTGGFPAGVLAALVVAELRRRSATALSVDNPVASPLRPAAVGLVLALADAVLCPAHDALDVGAVMILGAAIARAPIDRAHWRQVVGHVVIGTVVFAFISYGYSVFKALTLVGGAQVDGAIAGFERRLFGGDAYRAVAAWASTRPWFVHYCDWVYFRFFHHMALTTALLTGLRQRTERFEYLGALAFCYVIGGAVYHVLPGVGPGFYDAGAYGYLVDPALVTSKVRIILFNNTNRVLSHEETVIHTWGYVACMPSLHIAQELVMLWYARKSRLAFAIAAAFTASTFIAVVVLGWHYFVDSAGGLAVAAAAIGLAYWQRDRLMPAAFAPEPDEPLPRRPLREWIAALETRLVVPAEIDDALAKRLVRVATAFALALRLTTGLRDLGATDRLFVPDDAYYTLSIARSLAHGLGPTANGFTPTNGFQPLIAFVTVPVFWLTSNALAPFVWVLVVSAVADAASTWLLGDLARRLGGGFAGVIAAALWALSPLAIANALDGLETATAWACQLAFVATWLRARESWRLYALAGLFAGLSLLARIDSVFLVVAVGLASRRRVVPIAAAAAVTVAPWWAYSLARFGTVVPESGAAVHAGLAVHKALYLTPLKQLAWMGGSLIGGSAADLPAARVWLMDFAPALGAALLALVLAALAWAVWRNRSAVVVVLAVHAVAVVALYALYLPALWFFRRYLESVYGLATLLFALAIARARTLDGPRRVGALGALVVAAAFAVCGAGHFLGGTSDSPAEGRALNGAKGYAEPAQEALALVPPGSVVGAFQSGALSYFAPPGVRIVNLDGVVDGEARRAMETQTVLDYAYRQHVDVIADWRFNLEGLRFVSQRSPRGIQLAPIGQAATAQGSDRFGVYRVLWP